MIFRSELVAAHWDTWGLVHEGRFYLYYLICERDRWNGFGAATSDDGVHWTDHGWALRASDRMRQYLGTGSVWKDPDFARNRRFLCNYSEYRQGADGKETQKIFFAWSTDLLHWEKFGDDFVFPIDRAHYERAGRWDCIYTLPRAAGGYWGTWTATPADSRNLAGGIGFGYSEDGLRWHALPPVPVSPPADESGAFAIVGEQVHAMFGVGGKGMVAYRAAAPIAPYAQAPRNPILLRGTHGYFSRYLATPDALLVNHHVMCGRFTGFTEATYLAPLKRAVVRDGIQRWVWWPGNEALKGAPGELAETRPSTSLTWLTAPLDFQRGLLAEGWVEVPEPGQAPATLFLYADAQGHAVQVHAGGRTAMGSFDPFAGVLRPDQEMDRELARRGRLPFRLLARRGMTEFYLGEDFIECWTLGRGPHGMGSALQAPTLRLGRWGAGAVQVGLTGLWQMSLADLKFGL